VILTRIDHVILAVGDLARSARLFEQLGLSLTQPMRHMDAATENQVFFVCSDTSEFYVELLSVHDRDRALQTGRSDLLQAIDRGGLMRVMMEVDDVDEARAELRAAGVTMSHDRTVRREDGSLIGEVLVPETDVLGLDVGLISYAESPGDRRRRHAEAGRFHHQLPLLRLDHLAAFVSDLDAATAAWRSILGVELSGRVVGRGMVIHQLQIGDAVLELIAPDGPDSPVAQRALGLASMAAFEVGDLLSCRSLLVDQGLDPNPITDGVLPNSETVVVGGEKLSNFTVQLISFGPDQLPAS